MPDRVVLHAEADVEPLLSRMELERSALIDVVRSAAGDRAFCTGNDIRGFDLITMNGKVVRNLRDRFCGLQWAKDETDNQEGIQNQGLKIRVIACNFDRRTANLLRDPTNLVRKGSASGRKVGCNGTGWLPGLPDIPTQKGSALTTWLLGSYVSGTGELKAELSLPVSFDGTKFRRFDTRIILLDGTEDGSSAVNNQPDRGKPVEEMDIVVRRK